MKDPREMTEAELRQAMQEARDSFGSVQARVRQEYLLFQHALNTMDKGEVLAVMGYVSTLIAFLQSGADVFGLPITFDDAELIPVHPDDAEAMGDMDA